MVQRGRTSHELLARVALAQMINKACGGAVVGPWDVDDLPETWLDVFRGLADEMPAMQTAQQKVQKVKKNFLMGHPTYGK